MLWRGTDLLLFPSHGTCRTTVRDLNSSHLPCRFFSNKGAVAGVFAVVGVIVVALVIAFVVNAIRRRRAQKFDRDVAEAAAEAAVSSHSPFDDYSYPNMGGNDGGGGGGGGGYGYSDNSHGTFQLPALHPQNNSYGMTEMAQYDPYAAGAASLAAAAAGVGRSRSRKVSEPGTPGIAGVGAGTLAREPSKRAPYHAFAGPGPQPYELQSKGTFRNPRGTNQDVLEAVGLADAGTTALTSNSPNNATGGILVTRKPSETTQNTHFSGRSQFGSMSNGHQWQSGYPVDSYYPQRNDSHNADPFAGYPLVAPASKALPNPYEATLSSPPPPSQQSDTIEDRPELASSTALHSDEQRLSYQDDTDYSHGTRVLRVR